MESYKDGVLDLAKALITEYILTPGRRVTAKPCYIFNVIVNPANAGLPSLVNLRNGETSVSEILVGLGAQRSHVTSLGRFPMYFNRGLYVETPTNVTAVTVQYLEEGR